MQHWSYNTFGKNTEYGFVFVDKDLEQTPCWRLNPSKLEKGIYWIEEDYANRVFFESLLSGDTSDAIPGVEFVTESIWNEYNLKGKKLSVGKGNAKTLLKDCKTKEDMILRVQDIYKEVYNNEWKEKLNLNYKLLKLLEKPNEIKDFPFSE